MFERWGLDDLLDTHRELRLVPSTTSAIEVAGGLRFRYHPPGLPQIEDSYDITLTVPPTFPEDSLSIRETGGRIPAHFHVFSHGTLCLGAPFRLRLIAAEFRTLLDFVERCVVPYLYGFSYFELHGVMPFGELEHGRAGLIQDLAALFGVDEDAAEGCLRLAAMPRRKANRHKCPCGSGRTLGECHNIKLNDIRNRAGRHALSHALRELRSAAR